MKVSAVSNHNQTTDNNAAKRDKLSFGSLGMNVLGATGAFMQGIESKGYWISFLIQDGLGMTFPRTLTGIYRDKDVTGEYNWKEGLEVAGREGMTGPFLMSVAPLMIWLTSKKCKSVSSNTRLIKAVGENFKQMLDTAEFNHILKQNKDAFRREFNRYNLEKFYKETIPNDNNYKETVNYILDEMKKLDSGNKKLSAEGLNNIIQKLNDRMIATSTDLDSLCRLSINVDGQKKVFNSDAVINAINNFGKDAIERNPQYAEIDAKAAENIKNNLAAKRMTFNIGTVAATLGGLSILPHIYAWNSVAPGATNMVKQMEEMKQQQAQASKEDDKKEADVSFKGKGINSETVWSKIGRVLTKKIPEWIQREFEYDGVNFTPSLMACLSVFGLITPRGLRAYRRAYVDDNGNRDWSEVKEILLRDPISSLAVVFTVPILQKVIVSAYENGQGFVLTNRAAAGKTGFRRTLDVLNPYSDLRVFKNVELESLYGNVDTKEKMMNFVKYIDQKGGDLEKILSKSTKAKEIFNENTFTLESLKKKPLADKNKQIIEFFEKLENNEATKNLINKLMKDNGAGKQGTIARIARGLNSVPGFLVTVIISPIILGVLIPLITYSNTRKAHDKMTSNMQQELNKTA